MNDFSHAEHLYFLSPPCLVFMCTLNNCNVRKPRPHIWQHIATSPEIIRNKNYLNDANDE